MNRQELLNKCNEYNKNNVYNSWDFATQLVNDLGIDYSLAHSVQVEWYETNVKSNWGYPWNKRG